ncbi:bifunctional riboflavin kinase/FMN phosphatase [Carica papaya]|uniref:bifunctional riboflavin kinase/FMN phosphatase n=1 Tax=Carica papaya TaxID=3649 RepID=UPI000B8CEADE|nr:bifunctional riboflavin kinase/FMN phosphatase [Carica papaya]
MSPRTSMANPLKKLASCVILDLDGTLLNTDGIVGDILRGFLSKYGKQWDGREAHKIVGKTPKEAAVVIVEEYGLPCLADEFAAEVYPLFSSQNIIPKGWNDQIVMFEFSNLRFLEAAKRLKKEPSSCLVIEDSIPGVTAGKAAGMEVVAVPSIPKQTHLYESADDILNSLLDLQPEKWGLPPFKDWIECTLPIEPWYIGGPVVKGFGRGSKVLGIPTANLSTSNYASLLSEHVSGVYFGWAGLSSRGVFKMVMSIGWNPYFNNTEKTIEPWLLHEFEEDFYGEELNLVIVGYIRPEANFPSLESLITKIHEDRRIAERALDLPLYSKYKDDPYLLRCSDSNCNHL